jgi:tetratricopeptide (TPR) repeat protein
LHRLHIELKRRNVYKGSLAYLAVAWIILQVFSILLPLIEAPSWVLKTITLILFIGFPFWVFFSWRYDITPEGIKKIESVIDIESNNRNRSKLINRLIFLAAFVALSILALNQTLYKNENDSIANPQSENSIPKKSTLSTNLKALEFFNKGEFNQKKETLSHINLAITNYKHAIELDSGFAMAYNNLASAYMRKNLSFQPDVKWEEEAYAAANIALQLDPTLANPHIIKGQFYWSPSHEFAHIEAINEFRNAIKKDQTLSQAYEQLALVQLHIGLFDPAEQNAQLSLKLDPGNYRARRFKAEILLFKGDYGNALKEFEKIPRSFAPQPTLAFRALTHIYLGEDDKALNVVQNAIKDNSNSPHINSIHAILLAKQGNVEGAKKKMEIAINNSDNFIHAHHIYYYLGIASLLVNDYSQAINWLEKASSTGFPNYLLYSSDPLLTDLKREQKFIDLLERLKQDWEYYKSI